IEYEGREVIIINESTSFDLKLNKLSDSTKILVGELGDKLFGLYVDEVMGIMDVANTIDNNLLISTDDRVIIGEIVLSEGTFKLIDLSLLAKRHMTRNKFTMISNKSNSKVYNRN
ncbi:MAG: hypothetical protein R3250_13245, partial [Melioribacteraceae bacterium]|nr:hypothetical protein [Melioribacteraceae bacterium]